MKWTITRIICFHERKSTFSRKTETLESYKLTSFFSVQSYNFEKKEQQNLMPKKNQGQNVIPDEG